MFFRSPVRQEDPYKIDFWSDMWNQAGNPRWHQSDFDSNLQRITGLKGRVFLPLCGGTRDLMWFNKQPLVTEVIGTEACIQGIKQFEIEQGIKFEVKEVGEFKVYVFEKIQIFLGNHFSKELVTLFSDEKFDLIFDRASLIAITKEMREEYKARMIKWLKPGGLYYLQTFNYDEKLRPNMPPRPFDKSTVESLYSDTFRIDELFSRRHADLQKGLQIETVIENFWLLKFKPGTVYGTDCCFSGLKVLFGSS